MTLSGSTRLNVDSGSTGQLVHPSSLSSAWQTVLAAGRPATQDAATATNPAVDVSAAEDRIFLRPAGLGTTLLLSLAYDDGLTGITDCVGRLFGRKDSDDRWTGLKDTIGNQDITLATDTTNDASDGTLNYTDPVLIDCLGCNEFVFVVQTALAGTGTVSTAYVEGKIV